MSRERRRDRKLRAATGELIAALAKNAEDPKRQALADIIEAVLKRADFKAAKSGPASEGSFPVPGTIGFWMRVDSIAPGIMLYATDYDAATNESLVREYWTALLAAFSPIVGKQAAVQHVRLHLGGVCILPFPAEQIQALHQQLAR